MLVSLIIPAYNSVKHISRCLDSIFSQKTPQIEVIAIDNGSSDSTYDFIKSKYPKAKLIKNVKNMGSSFARNQGISASSGEYIMFMDSDVYLKEDFFISLERVLKELPSHIGGISPRILKADSQRAFSCGLYISCLYRVYDIGRNRAGDEFCAPFVIDGPNSCCGIFKRECLDKAMEKGQYFDEDFFFLFEDADLALRLKEKGYRCLFMPELICYHYGGGSGISKDFRRYLSFRNRWYMILKIKDRPGLFRFILKSLPYDFLRTLHFSITNRYFLAGLRDIYRKIRYEKGPDF